MKGLTVSKNDKEIKFEGGLERVRFKKGVSRDNDSRGVLHWPWFSCGVAHSGEGGLISIFQECFSGIG